MQVIQNGTNLSPYLLIRTLHRNQGWYSMMGAHELCVSREGSALQLKRWCRVDQLPKPWAVLYFLTWEGKRTSQLGAKMRARQGLTLTMNTAQKWSSSTARSCRSR